MQHGNVQATVVCRASATMSAAAFTGSPIEGRIGVASIKDVLVDINDLGAGLEKLLIANRGALHDEEQCVGVACAEDNGGPRRHLHAEIGNAQT